MTHAQRAHAVLSASSAHRWLTCPPSARLEEQFEDTTSEYAKEGTAAHELAELHLQRFLGKITKHAYTSQLNRFKKENEYFSQEMLDYTQNYADIVIEKINEARAQTANAVVLLEQRLDFSPWVPEGFGTGDVVIISEGTIEVIDLKYGKGVPVSAINNSQMRLYALGALNQFGMLYDIECVRMTIVQPRLDSISTDELLTEMLLKWANEVVKPTAEQAYSGEGEFLAGDHCRFCRVRYTCRARAEKNLELARYEFQSPPELTHVEIGKILTQADQLQKWVKDVQKYALNQAEKHGAKFPGWKLVEGRSNRKYADEEVVVSTLKANGFSEDKIYQKKLLGITAMEKLLGKKKFEKLLGELVVKPAGKPALVPESDKRPELSSTASAVGDFS